MFTAVPAFWSVPTQSGCIDETGQAMDCWIVLEDSLAHKWPNAGKNHIVVFGDDTWPTGNAAQPGTPIPGTVDKVAHVVAATGCTALGYVVIRKMDLSMRDETEVLQECAAWLNNYNLDGIYFDMAVLPGHPIIDPQGGADPHKYVVDFKLAHPGKQVMVLAGMCADPWVVAGGADAPDSALLWEDTVGQYQKEYGASDQTNNAANLEIPDWWKDPTNRLKICHTVAPTGSNPADWQDAFNRAIERNTGHLFTTEKVKKYDSLPSYWWTLASWMGQWENPQVGLAPYQLLRAAHRWAALDQTKPHGWPNGEQAWYANGQVRGTYTIEPKAPGVSRQTITLPGSPPLYNVSKVWSAVQAWATSGVNPFLASWPTFVDVGVGQYEVIAIDLSVQWATVGTISGTYQPTPTFADPMTLLRNIHRAAQAAGYMTALPTFKGDNLQGTKFGGQLGTYQVIFIHQGAPVTWQDVLGTTYAQYA